MSPCQIYQKLVDQGDLEDDANQRAVARRLSELAEVLPAHEENMEVFRQDLDNWRELRARKVEKEYERRRSMEETNTSGSWRERLRSFFGEKKEPLVRPEYLPDEYYGLSPPPKPPSPPMGIYLYGGVGAGKSMMMDILFEATAANLSNRRRVHFHSFMLELYDRCHKHDITEREKDRMWLLKMLEEEETRINAISEGEIDESMMDGNPDAGDAEAQRQQILKGHQTNPMGLDSTHGPSNPHYPNEMKRRRRDRVKKRRRRDGVLETVSAEMVGGRKLMFLCFDELQLNDIGDAMLIKGLFKQLFDVGVVVVATGNRPPSELNRSLLRKDDWDEFLTIFTSKCESIELKTGQDYRLLQRDPSTKSSQLPINSSPAPFYSPTSSYPFSYASPVCSPASLSASPFFTTLWEGTQWPDGFPYFLETHILENSESSTARLQKAYELAAQSSRQHPDRIDLAGFDAQDGAIIPVLMGRSLHIPRCEAGVAYFKFEELCARPLGAADYIAICHHFHTLVLEGIPQMSYQIRDQARRFITLVDELYNHKVKLICSAAVGPTELFSGKDVGAEGAREADILEGLQFEYEANKPNVTAMHDHALISNTIFTGEDESFAFARASSRLLEMQSLSYLQRSILA